jgi:RHS repeat-associated protein
VCWIAYAKQTISRTYSYDPDGTTTTTGSGPNSDLRFAAGHRLPGGLYHFGARFYNPTTARRTQQDPRNRTASLTDVPREPSPRLVTDVVR